MMPSRGSTRSRTSPQYATPQILFQRLVMVGQRSMDITEMFAYELCAYPASLFDKNLLMRTAPKSDLIRVLVEMTSGQSKMKKWALEKYMCWMGKFAAQDTLGSRFHDIWQTL